MKLELFEQEMKTRLTPRRFNHIIGCRETACRLAEKWGVDVRDASAAALLHDITKELTTGEQLKFAEKHGIMISDTQHAVPETLHAITGAKAAQVEFGVPEHISRAIRWHCTSKPGMTILEKIIWLADMTEPGRRFDGVERIRRTSFENLDLALLMGINRTLEYLIDSNGIIDPIMLESRNWLITAGVV